MNRFLILLLVLNYSLLSFAQDEPTIIVEIPTEQKPWNHIEWNASPEQFQFAIVTDRTGGHRPGVFPEGIKKLNLLQPEFVMSVGDLIEGYTKDTVQLNAEWNEFKGFIEPLDAPFFYVPGNHDITNDVMEKKWEELFGVSYYHFVYKDVLFLCLNSEDNLRGAGKGTIDNAQYDYIEKVLRENEDVKWTLVFIHQPLWIQKDTKRWKDVENLLSKREHNVFAGHYHRYWKTEKNNGKYIALATTGGGSSLRGAAYGEFDHVVWVTMTEEGPILANLFLNGIWDENVVTEEIVELVRNQPFPVKIQPIYSEKTMFDTIATEVKITNNMDVKMQVDLKGFTHDELYYQLDKTSVLVEPNDAVVFPLKIKNLNKKNVKSLQPIQIEAAVTYLFNEKPNISFSNILNTLPFYKNTVAEATKKVKVDGKLKEWEKAKWITVENVDGSPFDYNGKDDLTMHFATSYDDNYLYLAMKIKDDEIYTNEEGSYWGQDAILVGVDARPQHISAFNKGKNRGTEWLGYLRNFRRENPVYGAQYLPFEIPSQALIEGNTITFEMALPLAVAKSLQGADWSNFRLNVGYYDFDENGESNSTHYWYPIWYDKNDIPGSGIIFRK